jgi:hypothetical protein
MSAPASSSVRVVPAAFALWGVTALAVAVSGALASLPPSAVPLLIWSPVLLAVWAWRRVPAVRAFADGVDLRVAVLYHTVRVLFGALFLWEMRAGRLPAAFAMIAGPGDIAAGLLALPAAWLVTRSGETSRRLALAWNVFAFADILAVFVSAQRMLFLERDLRFFALMRTLPYATLPVLVVPLILLTHLLILQRLRSGRR